MENHTETKLTDHQRNWLSHIRACEASGQCMKDYATAQELSLRKMYDAKKVLVKKGVLPRSHRNRFQRVRLVQPDTPSVNCEWTVKLPNAVAVRFSGVVNATELATILKVAGAIQ